MQDLHIVADITLFMISGSEQTLFIKYEAAFFVCKWPTRDLQLIISKGASHKRIHWNQEGWSFDEDVAAYCCSAPDSEVSYPTVALRISVFWGAGNH
jgi:hypothetical protein